MTYYSRANGFFIQADALGSAVHEAATSAVERPSHTTCPGDEHSTTHHGFKVLICSKHIVPPPFFILRVPSVFPEDTRIIPLFTYCVNRFIKVFYSRALKSILRLRACTQKPGRYSNLPGFTRTILSTLPSLRSRNHISFSDHCLLGRPLYP